MRDIRVLGLPEVELLLGWATHEGWNPGLGDAAAFHAADPNGFLGAFIGSTMVAAIAAVAYDAHFGFIGLYICHPDWRGQGHGKAVWDAGMDHLGSRTIGLDGVPEQQANYARMGFVPAYQTIRMSGMLAVAPSAQTFASARLEDISALDRACFPARRDEFLRHWLAPPNRSLLRYADGAADAYAVLRPCHAGFKLGPLFAPDADAAIDLLATLEACAGASLPIMGRDRGWGDGSHGEPKGNAPQSGPLQIDVPAMQRTWLEALAERGFTPGFATTRMYRGPAPAIDLARIFGVTSLELG